MKHTYLVLCVLALACDHMKAREQSAFIPDCYEAADRERLAKFVIDCAAAANPKSDEEGEDLVAQCERTGRELCPRRTVRFWCETEMQRPNEHNCRRLK